MICYTVYREDYLIYLYTYYIYLIYLHIMTITKSHKNSLKIDSKFTRFIIKSKSFVYFLNQFRTAGQKFVDGSFTAIPLSHSLSLDFFFDSLIRSGQMYLMPLELILEDRMSVWDPLWATLTNRAKFIREKKERGRERERERERERRGGKGGCNSLRSKIKYLFNPFQTTFLRNCLRQYPLRYDKTV